MLIWKAFKSSTKKLYSLLSVLENQIYHDQDGQNQVGREFPPRARLDQLSLMASFRAECSASGNKVTLLSEAIAFSANAEG